MTGCLATMEPSDAEAVKLLKNYYSYYEEKGVDVTIMNRGSQLEECKCTPIEFLITHSEKDINKKTFYFFKNAKGDYVIKKFKYGVKFTS